VAWIEKPRAGWWSSVAAAVLGPVLAAQTEVRLTPALDFLARGGRVVAVDVDVDGRRLVAVGEYDDVVVAETSGVVLGEGVLPGAGCTRYLALHPVRPTVVFCLDRSGTRDAPAACSLGLLAVGPRAGSAGAAPRARDLQGAVLGMAWNAEGSLLAVARVTPGGSCVDVFTPRGVDLQQIESVPVASLVDLLGSKPPSLPLLDPFLGRWRCTSSELLPRPNEDEGDHAPSDALLVADAQARFARFAGSVGLGVDRIGQVFVRSGNRTTVHAFCRGPVLGLAFTPDGRFVAAASRAALTVGALDGSGVRTVPGKRLVAPGERGSELTLLGAKVETFDAATGNLAAGALLPAADTGTGEDDGRLYDRPQLRTALRLDDGRFVVGGYSQFGHEGLLVDVQGRSVLQVADSEREADERLVVDVKQTVLLTPSRWLARESLRAYKGAFRVSSVVRAFAGERPLWAREFTRMATAMAAPADGGVVAVADGAGELHLLDGETGTTLRSVALPRAPQWLGFLDGRTLLAHDGVELMVLAAATFEVRARAALPAGAPVDCTALDAAGLRIAFGRGPRVQVLALTLR